MLGVTSSPTGAGPRCTAAAAAVRVTRSRLKNFSPGQAGAAGPLPAALHRPQGAAVQGHAHCSRCSCDASCHEQSNKHLPAHCHIHPTRPALSRCECRLLSTPLLGIACSSHPNRAAAGWPYTIWLQRNQPWHTVDSHARACPLHFQQGPSCKGPTTSSPVHAHADMATCQHTSLHVNSSNRQHHPICPACSGLRAEAAAAAEGSEWNTHTPYQPGAHQTCSQGAATSVVSSGQHVGLPYTPYHHTSAACLHAFGCGPGGRCVGELQCCIQSCYMVTRTCLTKRHVLQRPSQPTPANARNNVHNCSRDTIAYRFTALVQDQPLLLLVTHSIHFRSQAQPLAAAAHSSSSSLQHSSSSSSEEGRSSTAWQLHT